MANSTFEAFAQLGAYSHTVPEQANEPVIRMMSQVASGDLEPGAVTREASRLVLPFSRINFGDWLVGAEADDEIAARIELQEAYADHYAAAARAVLDASAKPVAAPGANFVAFRVEGTDGPIGPAVAKFTIKSPYFDRVKQVERALHGLLLSRNLHPNLEQVLGVSYTEGAVASGFVPGSSLDEVGPDVVTSITGNDIETGFEALILGGMKRLTVDYFGGKNFRISPERGFGFIDLGVSSPLSQPSLRPTDIAVRNCTEMLAAINHACTKRGKTTDAGAALVSLARRANQFFLGQEL